MKKIFSGLLIFVILIHFASAQATNASKEVLDKEIGLSTINYINIDIGNNGFATVEYEILVNNTIASIFVPLHVDVLSISDSKNTLKYELLPEDGGQLLTFYLVSPMDKTVRIKYNTEHLTGKNGSIWTLKFLASATPYHTIVNVRFPIGSNITSLKSDIPRYPANLTNTLWLYPQTNEFYVEMDYRTMQGSQLSDGDNGNYLYYILIIAVAILLIILYLLLSKAKKSKRPAMDDTEKDKKIVETEENNVILYEKKEDSVLEDKNKRKIKESIIKMLDENEKKIIDMLEYSENEITQAYVYKTTGIPKSSLSDIIQRLEKRNILERRKDGRVSWIKLKDWVLE